MTKRGPLSIKPQKGVKKDKFLLNLEFTILRF